MAITHWGLALVAVIEQKGEREGFWQGLASGLPFFPLIKPDTTKVDL
jgi:hypothetical protein